MTEHLCVDCLALPEIPKGKVVPREQVRELYRPKAPAKIVSGNTKRSWRCTYHTRAKKARDKERARFATVARTYGLTPAQYVALLVYQNYLCAVCKVANGKTKALAVDHDHRLAKLHPHDEKKACVDCVRGLLCSVCNQILIGRYNKAQLQNAIDYKEEPPFVRMRRLGLVPAE